MKVQPISNFKTWNVNILVIDVTNKLIRKTLQNRRIIQKGYNPENSYT